MKSLNWNGWIYFAPIQKFNAIQNGAKFIWHCVQHYFQITSENFSSEILAENFRKFFHHKFFTIFKIIGQLGGIWLPTISSTISLLAASPFFASKSQLRISVEFGAVGCWPPNRICNPLWAVRLTGESVTTIIRAEGSLSVEEMFLDSSSPPTTALFPTTFSPFMLQLDSLYSSQALRSPKNVI